MRASVKGLSGTFTGSFFWRRNISFRFGQFVSVLTEAIFSFNFWETASIVSLGEAKNGFIFGINFWLRVWSQNLSFWRLWQVIPDWLVLDATGCEQSELLLLCCGSTSMIPAASLWNKSLATGCSMMVYQWGDTCCLLGFKTMQRNCRGTSKCLQSCWGLEKLVLVSWKCHAVAWHHGLTKFGDKRVNDLDLLSGYVVGVACLHRENPCRRICKQLAPRTSWSSVLYLSFLFAMLCSSSFCCIFICTNPKQTFLMSARSSFHWGMSTFLVTPSMCCVFICTNSRHTLKTSLCCAFYWRKPCHDHTFDLLCFHMYKPQSNLNSRQRTKPTFAARKKEINWTFL